MIRCLDEALSVHHNSGDQGSSGGSGEPPASISEAMPLHKFHLLVGYVMRQCLCSGQSQLEVKSYLTPLEYGFPFIHPHLLAASHLY
jgi:hypothetical protein